MLSPLILTRDFGIRYHHFTGRETKAQKNITYRYSVDQVLLGEHHVLEEKAFKDVGTYMQMEKGLQEYNPGALHAGASA